MTMDRSVRRVGGDLSAVARRAKAEAVTRHFRERRVAIVDLYGDARPVVSGDGGLRPRLQQFVPGCLALRCEVREGAPHVSLRAQAKQSIEAARKMDCFVACAPRNDGFLEEYRFNQGGDLPVGLSRDFPVQPLCEKFSAFPVGQITFINSPRPASTRGAYASSRTWGGMRWTRAAHGRMRLTRGRRSRVVLTPRRWRQVRGKTPRAMVANKPGHQGEREGNR